MTAFYSRKEKKSEDIFSVKWFLLLQKGANSILSKLSIGLAHKYDVCPNHKRTMYSEIAIPR